MSSPLRVYGDSFPKTSSTVVILCSGGEDDSQSVLWLSFLVPSFPFSFLVPSTIFSELKQEHPSHLRHRVPHVHSHHRDASQILTGSGGQKAVGSNLGSQI